MSHAKAFTELLMIDFGLKCLNIEKCGLDDEVLKMVMQSALGSSTLSWLSLANNPKVKTQGVKYIAVFLKKSSSIRYLDISGISLDQQGASYLNHAFSADSEKGFRQSSVEVLKMDNSSIKSVHLEVMATGIRRSRLTHLSMRRNLLSAHAGKQLARILENTESCGSSNPILHGSSLKALDVRDNAIGSGVVDIAQALALNDQLTRLVLRSNRVDAAGFTAVVNALNTNSTLRTLDMGQNSLFSSEHPTAIESLKQMLCTNSVLSGIFLSNTNMRTNDLISLSEALPFSKCIQKLDLSHNVFEAPGFMALATVMESNTHITHIALSPLKSLKGKNSVDVDVETLNAIARMSTILNRNASSKKTDVLPPVSIRRSSSPQEMSSLDAEEEEEEEESDTEVSPTPSALRRDSLVLSLEMRKTRRSMDTIRDGTLDTSLTNEMISKEAEAFRLQVEQRLRSAEETSSVLAEIVDLAHVQMKSGIRPSRSQCELLKQLRDESVHFQTKIYDTLSLVDKTIDRERLTVKSLEISDHINRTIKRHDDLEYSQIASKKVQSPLGAPADEKPAENMPESNPKKSVDYPQRSSSVANILAPLAIPEAPVPTLPLNPILPTSLKTAGPGALHPARKASLTTNFAAYPNSLLFLKNDGDSLKLSVLAHDGPTSSKTVISPSTSPNLASGSDLHTKVGHPANSGAHVPVAATLLPPTDSAQKRDNSSLVSLAGTIAGKRV
ncbi:hypothetical protein BASA62_005354 [Batrachochytrium salamandrivorans]|nr:hypothetical protein BASA62_005354 [Batrachochytrium salamandrivorans]